MQIVDFSFVSALALPRHLLAVETLREAMVSSTADGESTLSTSHHADRAYAMRAAALDRRRSCSEPPRDMRAAALGALDPEWPDN